MNFKLNKNLKNRYTHIHAFFVVNVVKKDPKITANVFNYCNKSMLPF